MHRTMAWFLMMMAFSRPALAEISADSVAERMLDALGGRKAWAELKTLVNDSCQYRVEAPTAVRTVISLDLQRSRFRIETWAPGLHLIRVVDGDRHWRLNRAGDVEPVPEATLEGDGRWYAGHVYRTIHRIAARDPRLRLGLGEGGRLEVFEDGARVAWFRLDERGEPFAFGGFDDQGGSISGPWTYSHAGIFHPIWTARHDGSFRSTLIALETPSKLDDSLVREPVRTDKNRDDRRPTEVCHPVLAAG